MRLAEFFVRGVSCDDRPRKSYSRNLEKVAVRFEQRLYEPISFAIDSLSRSGRKANY